MSWSTRSAISRAAFSVKVRARISSGRARLLEMRWAMRRVRTVVLPVPAPAMMSSGRSPWRTASRWASERPRRIRSSAGTAVSTGASATLASHREDPTVGDLAPAETRQGGRRGVQDLAQPNEAIGRGGVHDDQRVRRLERDHGAGRVGRGVAEGTGRIDEHRPRFDVHGTLPDPFVRLARAPPAQHDRGLELVPVVEPERELGPQRAEVERVHQGIDPVEGLPLQGAPQEGFAGGPGLRGVEPEGLVERAGVRGARHLGALAVTVAALQLPARTDDLGLQRVVLLAEREAEDLEYSQAYAAGQLGRDPKVGQHGAILFDGTGGGGPPVTGRRAGGRSRR